MEVYKLFLAGILAISFMSCSNLPEHVKYIPHDAQFVASVDMNKMGKKLIWNAITGSTLFTEMQEKLKDTDAKSAMKDISEVGLNQQSSIYFFMNGGSTINKEACLLVGMKDEKKFESFLQKNFPSINLDSKSNYKSGLLEPSIFTAWNDEVAFFFPIKDSIELGGDSVSMSFQLNQLDKVRASLDGLFSMDKKNSLIANSHFKDLLKAKNDVSFWLNYEELFMKNVSTVSNPFIKQDYFKEAALATGINFEKGAAQVEMDYFMSKEMSKIYKKYEKTSFDQDLIKPIPSKDIAFLLAYNIDLEMLQDYLKQFGLDGLTNMGLGLAGTSMETIKGAFKGDMVISCTDLKPKAFGIGEKDSLIKTSMPDMNLNIALGVKHQSDVERLLGVGIKNKLLVKKGKNYSLQQSGEALGISLSKDKMIYSSNLAMSEAYLNGKQSCKEAMPGQVWSTFSSSPMLVFVDLNKILHALKYQSHSSEEAVFVKELQNVFTYVEMHGGKMKRGANHFEGNLFFTNKEENALIQLIDLSLKAKKLKELKSDSTSNAALVQ